MLTKLGSLIDPGARWVFSWNRFEIGHYGISTCGSGNVGVLAEESNIVANHGVWYGMVVAEIL